MPGQRLTRDLSNSMIGSVCAGLAARYDIDVSIVRIVMVLLVFTGGIGVPLYIAAWIVMPRDDGTSPASSKGNGAPASLAQEFREVSDRVGEAARIVAGKTREAAEEISEIARRARTEASTPADETTSSPPASTAPATPSTPHTPSNVAIEQSPVTSPTQPAWPTTPVPPAAPTPSVPPAP